MFVAAIKCDFCGQAHEVNGRKTGKPDVPDGWATISPMITIKGTPNYTEYEPNKSKNKLYRERRERLRERFDRYHVCLDCIEQILTGKVSLKLGMNGDKS